MGPDNRPIIKPNHAPSGQSDKNETYNAVSMSDNFWDVNLAKQDEQGEELEIPKEKELVEPAVEIDVSLSDFPVGNWDSDNDAMHIVLWLSLIHISEPTRPY